MGDGRRFGLNNPASRTSRMQTQITPLLNGARNLFVGLSTNTSALRASEFMALVLTPGIAIYTPYFVDFPNKNA